MTQNRHNFSLNTLFSLSNNTYVVCSPWQVFKYQENEIFKRKQTKLAVDMIS